MAPRRAQTIVLPFIAILFAGILSRNIFLIFIQHNTLLTGKYS